LFEKGCCGTKNNGTTIAKWQVMGESGSLWPEKKQKGRDPGLKVSGGVDFGLGGWMHKKEGYTGKKKKKGQCTETYDKEPS